MCTTFATTNVQQTLRGELPSQRLSISRFIRIFSMQRREFLKTTASCGVARTLPKAFGQQGNVCRKSEPQEAGSMNQIPLTSSPRNFVWRDALPHPETHR